MSRKKDKSRLAVLLIISMAFVGQDVLSQEVRSFDPRGVVIGLNLSTATYSGDAANGFENMNAGFRAEAFYNLSEHVAAGLTFTSSKYGLTDKTRGSLGAAARFRFLEEVISPYFVGGFHIVNGGEKTGVGPMAGLGFEWLASDRFAIFQESLWQASLPDNAFEGIEGDSGIDNLFTIGFGVRLRLTQPVRPKFTVEVDVPDTVLIGDIVTLRAMVAGAPSSPVTLSWRVEQVTEYRGESVRHAFQYLGPQRLTLAGRNKRYEVRQTADIVVVDDEYYRSKDDPFVATPSTRGHVKIVEIYGRRRVQVGETENYRVRLRPGAFWPVNYRWEMGDGSELVGNNVLHRYDTPGQYTMRAIASNSLSIDTLTTEVLVVAGPAEAAVVEVRDTSRPATSQGATARPRRSRRYHPDELRSLQGINAANGGYGWVVGNYFDRPPAEARMRQFRVKGFRTGIVTDSRGEGSTAYRVVVGQFASTDNALAAKTEVQRQVAVPVSLLDIANPSSPVAAVVVGQAVEPNRTRPAVDPNSDTTPPLLSAPRVTYGGAAQPTALTINQLEASDLESNISRIEYRVVSVDGEDVWTDWTRLAEPGLASVSTTAEITLPLLVQDQNVSFEVRATNGAGLVATTSTVLAIDIDETPPTFDGTEIRIATVNSDRVIEMILRSVDDRESGVAALRYRVLDAEDETISLVDWTDVTGRDRAQVSLSGLPIDETGYVIVELEAMNAAGSVSSYSQSVRVPARDDESAPVRMAVSNEVTEPVVERVTDAGGSQVRSVRVYVRDERLLVFLDGLTDRSSKIERVEYRVLGTGERVLADWAEFSLVPPGRSSYGLQMHRVPIPAGMQAGRSRVELRIINGLGTETRVVSEVGDGS